MKTTKWVSRPGNELCGRATLRARLLFVVPSWSLQWLRYLNIVLFSSFCKSNKRCKRENVKQWHIFFNKIMFFTEKGRDKQSPGCFDTKSSAKLAISFEGSLLERVGGAVASWLVCSTPDRAVRVRVLVGDTVLCSWARHLLSQRLSPPRCINGYRQIVGET